MMRVFMAILCSLLAVCSVSARDRRHEETDRQATIYRLPPLRERCDARNILRVGTLKNITRMWDMGISCYRAKGIRHAP